MMCVSACYRIWIPLAALLLCASATVRCDRAEQKSEETSSAPNAQADELPRGEPAPRGFPAPGPFPVPASSGPGPAWFGTKEKGLVRLDAEGFHHVMVGPPHVQQIVPALPKGLWVLAQYRLFLVNGDKVDSIATDPTWGPIERITSGPKGEVWTVASKRIGRFDGTSWSYLDRAEIAPNKETVTIKDIDVDDYGRIYLCSKNSIYVMQDSAWREVPVDLGSKDVLQGLALFQDASAWLWTRQQAVHVGRTRWETRFKQLEPPGLRRLLVAPDGVWFLEDGLVLLQGDLEGKPTPRLDLALEPVKAKRIRSSFVDSSGRVWMGTDKGLAILEKGGVLTFWPQSAVPLLDSDVRALFVEGSGPRLPSVGTP